MEQTQAPLPAVMPGALPPAPPSSVAVIESIATGAPAAVFDQADAAARTAALFDDPEQRERITRIYRNTRVDTRRLAVDPTDPEFARIRTTPANIRERMNLFYTHAAPLAVDVAGRAVAEVPGAVDDIGMLIFVTSTGFIAPGVDVAVIRGLGLSPTVSRLVVNFMGCAAAMNGIRTASDYVRAHPDRKALLVCLEVSSVNAAFADDVNDIVTHSLFGDGAAAVVIGAGAVQHPLTPGKVVIRDTFTHLFDDAADGIVLGINHNGITCELSLDLPDYILAGVRPAVTAALAPHDLGIDDIDLWAIHPGGPKIISESVRSLQVAPEVAAASWDVLAGYGNLLSVALLFVLERLVAQQEANSAISTGVAFSFGPGVALEGMLFDIIGR